MQIKFSPRSRFPGRGPCIQLYGDWVTTKVWQEVSIILNDNFIDSPVYNARREANAFFQGGSHDARGKWILIECWSDEEKCADFLKILNYRLYQVIDNHKTCICIMESELSDSAIKALCKTIAEETGCRMETDVLHAKAVFYPHDNLVYEEVLERVNKLGLNRERWRDQWEEDERRSNIA